MFSPIWSGKRNRSDEEVAEWERQQAKLNQDYESPWLSALVTFSGFVAAFIGRLPCCSWLSTWPAAQGGCRTHSCWPDWWETHLCLRAVRYQKRRMPGDWPAKITEK